MLETTLQACERLYRALFCEHDQEGNLCKGTRQRNLGQPCLWEKTVHLWCHPHNPKVIRSPAVQPTCQSCASLATKKAAVLVKGELGKRKPKATDNKNKLLGRTKLLLVPEALHPGAVHVCNLKSDVTQPVMAKTV